MDEIEFRAEGIILRERVEALGETKVEEKTIKYEERNEYELLIDTDGYVPFERLISVEYDDNEKLTSLRIHFEDIPAIEAAIRAAARGENENNVPDVPRVELDEIEVQARRDFYQRLREHEDSQPAVIRRIIHSESELTRNELDTLIEEAGYEPSGGGVGQSLKVLEAVTNEIKRQGWGDDQRIIWIGSD